MPMCSRVRLRACLRWLAALIAVVAPAPSISWALDVIGYSAAVNDRFSSGYPAAPVTNTS